MPQIQAPPSRGVSVTVRVINTGAKIICPTDTCCQPRIKGHESLNLPTLAFLIEHEPSRTKILFDAGVRKDFQHFSPAGMRQLNKCVPDMHVPYDVRDVLIDTATGKASLNAHILAGMAIMSGWVCVTNDDPSALLVQLILGVLGIFVVGRLGAQAVSKLGPKGEPEHMSTDAAMGIGRPIKPRGRK